MAEEILLEHLASLGLALALMSILRAFISRIRNLLIGLMKRRNPRISLLGIQVSFLFLAFLFLMLLNEPNLILIEMPENVIVIKQIFVASVFKMFNFFIGHLVAGFVDDAIPFVIEFLCPFLDIIKRIKGIHELDHAF